MESGRQRYHDSTARFDLGHTGNRTHQASILIHKHGNRRRHSTYTNLSSDNDSPRVTLNILFRWRGTHWRRFARTDSGTPPHRLYKVGRTRYGRPRQNRKQTPTAGEPVQLPAATGTQAAGINNSTEKTRKKCSRVPATRFSRSRDSSAASATRVQRRLCELHQHGGRRGGSNDVTLH